MKGVAKKAGGSAEAAWASRTEAARHFYDRIAPAYDLIANASEYVARDRGVEALAPEPSESVLEIGSGTGRALVEISQRFGGSGRICGLDLSLGMSTVARQRLAAAGIGAESVELCLGDAHRLPFSDASFNSIFMSFTLELFEPKEIPTVLAEVRRVLRAGGRIAVVALEASSDRRMMSECYRWFHRHFPHIVDCQPIEAARLISAAGFRIEDVLEMSIWSLPVVVVAARLPPVTLALGQPAQGPKEVSSDGRS